MEINRWGYSYHWTSSLDVRARNRLWRAATFLHWIYIKLSFLFSNCISDFLFLYSVKQFKHYICNFPYNDNRNYSQRFKNCLLEISYKIAVCFWLIWKCFLCSTDYLRKSICLLCWLWRLTWQFFITVIAFLSARWCDMAAMNKYKFTLPGE